MTLEKPQKTLSKKGKETTQGLFISMSEEKGSIYLTPQNISLPKLNTYFHHTEKKWFCYGNKIRDNK